MGGGGEAGEGGAAGTEWGRSGHCGCGGRWHVEGFRAPLTVTGNRPFCQLVLPRCCLPALFSRVQPPRTRIGAACRPQSWPLARRSSTASACRDRCSWWPSACSRWAGCGWAGRSDRDHHPHTPHTHLYVQAPFSILSNPQSISLPCLRRSGLPPRCWWACSGRP